MSWLHPKEVQQKADEWNDLNNQQDSGQVKSESRPFWGVQNKKEQIEKELGQAGWQLGRDGKGQPMTPRHK